MQGIAIWVVSGSWRVDAESQNAPTLTCAAASVRLINNGKTGGIAGRLEIKVRFVSCLVCLISILHSPPMSKHPSIADAAWREMGDCVY